MQLVTVALAALLGVASAQSTKVWVVEVAKNGTLTYSPNQVTAAVGDMVQFQFLAGNHTITQSTFDQPCQPINLFNSSIPGFFSGFMPVSASAGQYPTYTIQINNTTPIWVYCAQAKHCEAGMSMVINQNTNANATRSLANYQSASSKATTVIPGTSSSSSSGGGATTSSGTTTTSGAGSLVSVPSTASLLLAAFAIFFL